MKKDKITIVIPTYKRPQLLAMALASAENQTVPPEEYRILVVDNDPQPNTETEKLVKNEGYSNVKYYKNRHNLGGYGNWNRGIQLAETEWICLLHDDDLLLPTCIENAYTILEKYDSPHLGAVIPRQCNLYDDPKEEYLEKNERTRNWKARLDHRLRDGTKKRMWKITLFDNYMVYSAYPAISGGNLLRRSAVLALGGFGTVWPCEDIFFLNRLAQVYQCFLLGQQWGWYRFGTNNRWAEPKELVRNDYAKKLFREESAKFDKRCAIYHRFFGIAMCFFDRDESVHFAKVRGKQIDQSMYKWIDGIDVFPLWKRLCRANRNLWQMWMSLRAILFGIRI